MSEPETQTPKGPEPQVKAGPDEDTLYAVRQKVYPRAVTGIFATWRWILVWATQLIFYGLCWLPWNGRQAVLLDVVERKFYIFDWVFWPQDVFFSGDPPDHQCVFTFFLYGSCRAFVVWLCMSANGVHRDFYLDRGEDRG